MWEWTEVLDEVMGFNCVGDVVVLGGVVNNLMAIGEGLSSMSKN